MKITTSWLLLVPFWFLLIALSASTIAGQENGEDSMPDEDFLQDDDGGDDDNDGIPLCNPLVQKTDVIVVGCGLAGLFAAAKLNDEGVSTIVVEADEICGGRLRSQRVTFDTTSFTFESHANFMYGRKKNNSRENPISKLFRNYDLDTIDYVTTAYNTNHWAVYKQSDGTLYDSATVETELQAFSRRQKLCLEASAGDWFTEYIRGRPPTDDERATNILKQCKRPSGWEPDTPLKEWITHFLYESEHGVQLSDLGRGSVAEEDYLFDFDLTRFFQNDADGSSVLIADWIDDHLSGVQIMHKTAVTRVRYATGKNVKTVAQSLLNDCKLVFRSKYVIVTPSIDVLREKIRFKPPQPIQTALDKHPMRITIMEKLWIKFSNFFWDNTKPFIGLANEQANGKASLFFNMNYFYPAPHIYANNNVLLCFVQEDMFTQLTSGTIEGKLTREQVEAHIADLLKVAQAAGQGSVSWTFEMTNFKDDPKFLGSWEMWQFGKTYHNFFDAIAPLNNKLFFAGAAHCSRYWGLTYGAIVSGANVGGWVADKAKGNNNAPRPYSPCEDANVISEAEWAAFYGANPFFERP